MRAEHFWRLYGARPWWADTDRLVHELPVGERIPFARTLADIRTLKER